MLFELSNILVALLTGLALIFLPKIFAVVLTIFSLVYQVFSTYSYLSKTAPKKEHGFLFLFLSCLGAAFYFGKPYGILLAYFSLSALIRYCIGLYLREDAKNASSTTNLLGIIQNQVKSIQEMSKSISREDLDKENVVHHAGEKRGFMSTYKEGLRTLRLGVPGLLAIQLAITQVFPFGISILMSLVGLTWILYLLYIQFKKDARSFNETTREFLGFIKEYFSFLKKIILGFFVSLFVVAICLKLFPLLLLPLTIYSIYINKKRLSFLKEYKRYIVFMFGCFFLAGFQKAIDKYIERVAGQPEAIIGAIAATIIFTITAWYYLRFFSRELERGFSWLSIMKIFTSVQLSIVLLFLGIHATIHHSSLNDMTTIDGLTNAGDVSGSTDFMPTGHASHVAEVIPASVPENTASIAHPNVDANIASSSENVASIIHPAANTLIMNDTGALPHGNTVSSTCEVPIYGHVSVNDAAGMQASTITQTNDNTFVTHNIMQQPTITAHQDIHGNVTFNTPDGMHAGTVTNNGAIQEANGLNAGTISQDASGHTIIKDSMQQIQYLIKEDGSIIDPTTGKSIGYIHRTR